MDCIGKERHVFILASGGFDSTMLMAYYHLRGYVLHPVKIDYDSRQIAPELTALTNILPLFPNCEPLIYKKLSLENPSTLSTERDPNEVETGEYKDFVGVSTVVPGRNLAFLAMLANIAEAYKLAHPDDTVVIASGVHKSDWAMYSDCRVEFLRHVSQAIRAGSEGRIMVDFPFENVDKSHLMECVSIDDELVVPQYVRDAIAYSYSCYRGKDKHCGTCPTCLERHQAFMNTWGEDPTEYEVNIEEQKGKKLVWFNN